MDLVIVESGAKAKTIQKYLGKNVLVRASVGHVQDLPTKGKDGSKALWSHTDTSLPDGSTLDNSSITIASEMSSSF